MLPASHRMRAGTDFQAAVRGGRRAGSPRVVVHTAVGPARPGGALVGFVVSKAVGGSVIRHRVARRLRAAVRPQLAVLPSDRLVVVRAQPAAVGASFADLESDVVRLLARTGATGSATADPVGSGAGRQTP